MRSWVYSVEEAASRPAAVGEGPPPVSGPSQSAEASGSAPDAVPSFRAEHNKIIWTIKAQLEIAHWPDSEEEFEVLVRPGR